MVGFDVLLILVNVLSLFSLSLSSLSITALFFLINSCPCLPCQIIVLVLLVLVLLVKSFIVLLVEPLVHQDREGTMLSLTLKNVGGIGCWGVVGAIVCCGAVLC